MLLLFFCLLPLSLLFVPLPLHTFTHPHSFHLSLPFPFPLFTSHPFITLRHTSEPPYAPEQAVSFSPHRDANEAVAALQLSPQKHRHTIAQNPINYNPPQGGAHRPPAFQRIQPLHKAQKRLAPTGQASTSIKNNYFEKTRYSSSHFWLARRL